MLILFKKCNMSANNYMRKKRGPPLFLAADPSTFSRHTEEKKKNVPMPGPGRVITVFFVVFFNSKSSVLSVCKGNTLQGDMVKKVALQWLTSPKNCRTHLVIPT